MSGQMGRSVLSVVMCGLLAMGAAGCRGGKDNLSDLDVLDPMSLGDDEYALGPRGEFGTPVTDVSFENVAFPFDSFQIADSERGKIEAVANYMGGNKDVTVVVDGHCDERGSREYNLSLGEHRALAVRAYLISLGVAGDRVQTRSFGEEQPLDGGHDESSWRQNRRGEFSLFR
jgi:peptidoglycan-associated lipoprotein